MAINKLALVILALLLFGCVGLESQHVQTEPEEKPVIQKLLEEGNEVTLALVFIYIESPGMIEMKGEQSFRSLAKACNTQLLRANEGRLLRKYRKYPNFKLLDRLTVDNLLKGYRWKKLEFPREQLLAVPIGNQNLVEKIFDGYMYQQMRYTMEVDAVKIGKLLSATHLMLVSYSNKGQFNLKYKNATRVTSGGWARKRDHENITLRLIDIQTASVLEVVERHNYGEWGKWEQIDFGIRYKGIFNGTKTR